MNTIFQSSAKTYLLLKDIFPQNAVDIGMMSKTGIKGILYRYFRKKEKKLYALSDRIGCMSPANVAYVIKHNPEVVADKVEVCPNCIDPVDMSIDADERRRLREYYGIPKDRTVLVYGGNLVKPQGIHFLNVEHHFNSFTAHYGLNCVPSKRNVEVLIPRISECDLVWS